MGVHNEAKGLALNPPKNMNFQYFGGASLLVELDFLVVVCDLLDGPRWAKEPYIDFRVLPQ